MKFSLDWLRDYVDFAWTPAELALRLTMLGHEVESVEPFGDDGDVVIDCEITPNRPDCLSVVGMAREIAAHLNGALRFPDCGLDELEPGTDPPAVSIEVTDRADCPRYSAGLVSGVRVGPSPLWLRDRIQAAGFRSINNIVDITNYVMLEIGQPLHAFDVSKVCGMKIVVRRGRTGERLQTLDGADRAVGPETLVISDAKRAIALAGIMGGIGSEIGEGTSDILIESAHFDRKLVRDGSKRLGLSTEASARFERGADPSVTVWALKRAIGLIAANCCGAPGGIVDVRADPSAPVRISLRVSRVDSLLGISLEASRVATILDSLGCNVEADGQSLSVFAPSFRPDLTREVDLIEEVARIHGYDVIPGRTEAMGPLGVERPEADRVTRRLVDVLGTCGFSEVITSSFVRRGDLVALGQADAVVSLSDPVSEDASFLRPSLLPNLMAVLRRNIHHGTRTVQIYELGRVFGCVQGVSPEGAKGESGCPSPVREEQHIAGLSTGFTDVPGWDRPPRAIDFYDMKGALEQCLDRLSGEKARVERSAGSQWLDPAFSASLFAREQHIGLFGQVRPEVLRALDIDAGPVFAFEFPVDGLTRVAAGHTTRFCELPRYPAVVRDFAVVLDDSIEAAEVIALVRSVETSLVEGVELFDLYRGKQVPAGKKSLAFSCTFRSRDRTLLDDEVDRLCEQIVRCLGERFGAVLRA